MRQILIQVPPQGGREPRVLERPKSQPPVVRRIPRHLDEGSERQAAGPLPFGLFRHRADQATADALPLPGAGDRQFGDVPIAP